MAAYIANFVTLISLLIFVAQSWQCKVTLGKVGTITVPGQNISQPSPEERWWGKDDEGLAWALYSSLERANTMEMHFQNVNMATGYLRIYQNRRLNPKTWKLFNETTTNVTSLSLKISNQSAVKIFASSGVSYVLTYKNYHCDVPDYIVAENCTNHWFRKSQCSFKCKDPTLKTGKKQEKMTSICRKSHRWSRKLDKVCKPPSEDKEPEFDLEKLKRIAENRGNQGESFDLDVNDSEITVRAAGRHKIQCYLYCLRRRSTKDYYFPCSHEKLSDHQERTCFMCRYKICPNNSPVFA